MTFNYIYVYVDPTKPGRYTYPNIPVSFLYEPFYIGKGKDRRWLDHISESKFYNRTAKHKKILDLLEAGVDVRSYVVLFNHGLEDSDIYSLERDYIDIVGRTNVKKGPLLNISPGGPGTPHGHTTKLSEADKSEIIEMYREGMCFEHIAPKFGVCGGTVSRVVKDAGLPSPGVRKVTDEVALDMYEKYTSGKYNQKDLEELYKVSYSTICKNIKRLGLPLKIKWIKDFSDKEQLEIAKKYDSGVSSRVLAEQYSISVTTVLKIVEICGFRKKTTSECAKKFTDEEEQEIYRQYVYEGLSTKELAAKYKVTVSSIVRYIKKCGELLDRVYLIEPTEAEVSDICSRYTSGESINNIAKALHRGTPVIRAALVKGCVNINQSKNLRNMPKSRIDHIRKMHFEDGVGIGSIAKTEGLPRTCIVLVLESKV